MIRNCGVYMRGKSKDGRCCEYQVKISSVYKLQKAERRHTF
jgi:hypothetical protein